MDIREVALAHFRALEGKNTSGQRYIISAKSLWMEEIVKILEEEFGQYGY